VDMAEFSDESTFQVEMSACNQARHIATMSHICQLSFSFPGIIVIAKDVLATYTLNTKAAITITELISTYLH
jgi:hypothetical protein